MPLFVDNSPPGSCVFCKLVAKEIPAAIVFEDVQTLAFMDLGQVNPGHVLVASKRHAANLLELTADEAAAVMRTAHHVARAVMDSFDPPGLTLLQANGKEGDQTVFHFHMHVVPRHAGDGIALSWPRKDPAREVLQAHALRCACARPWVQRNGSTQVKPTGQPTTRWTKMHQLLVCRSIMCWSISNCSYTFDTLLNNQLLWTRIRRLLPIEGVRFSKIQPINQDLNG
jgi:histidine triad (HIT) family protein